MFKADNTHISVKKNIFFGKKNFCGSKFKISNKFLIITLHKNGKKKNPGHSPITPPRLRGHLDCRTCAGKRGGDRDLVDNNRYHHQPVPPHRVIRRRYTVAPEWPNCWFGLASVFSAPKKMMMIEESLLRMSAEVAKIARFFVCF